MWKKKILIWIDDSSFLQFCFSSIIQQNSPDQFFAIADVNNNSKTVLKTQNLLKFSKISFFRDNLNYNSFHDFNYLRNFEKKFRINLWAIIYSERLFFHYNNYYKFSHDYFDSPRHLPFSDIRPRRKKFFRI